MKKPFIFLFFSLLCYSNIANAQEYVPIPDNHIWSVSADKFKTCGDTIINGKSYLKVYWQTEREPFEFDLSQAEYHCALRNDTLNKRVYAVYPCKPCLVYEYPDYDHYNPLFIATDTTELLLYDFSINVGDTVSIYVNEGDIFKVKMKRVEYIDLGEDPYYYINADSLQILENGDYRRRILMCMDESYMYCYPMNSAAWIEGIGSIYGLVRHFLTKISTALDVGWVLLCCANEDELLWSTPWNTNDNCYKRITDINENRRNMELIIYPNPATDFIRIKNMEIIDLYDCWIEIFDVYGKSILKQKYEDKIDVSALKAGYYILKATTSNATIITNRFVKF